MRVFLLLSRSSDSMNCRMSENHSAHTKASVMPKVPVQPYLRAQSQSPHQRKVRQNQSTSRCLSLSALIRLDHLKLSLTRSCAYETRSLPCASCYRASATFP